MYYGGDYNPEQWPESVWDDDVALMQEAKVNLVSLGIFSWAALQPREGQFEFGWLDRILTKLHEGGIGVDLATATASPPPWLVRHYPDVLPVTEHGVALSLGSRQHYAPTSSHYRRLAADLVTAIAERYADHPAVRMWHVNNEYGCHVHADYSDNAATAFRSWLCRRYETVEALNTAWGTDFWSQRYGDFDEVAPPRAAPYNQNPSAVLDFRRFTSDSILELYTMERDIIRRAGATQPITTNFMGTFPALDYWKWAAEVDIVSDDNYADPRDPEAFRRAAFSRDLMRSLKPGQPWLLMEQAPNAVQWRPNNAPKPPGQMRAWSEQAVARGAAGVMFFQWRQSRAGQEKFHSAMVPQSGTRSATWKEVVQLGVDLDGRSPFEPHRGQVAIVFDWENWWALRQPDLPAEIDYESVVFTFYKALHAANIQCSFVRPGDDLAPFSLVIAPTQYLLSAQDARTLERFVDSGGTLLTTAFTDIVDETDRFREGGYGRQLAELLGGEPIDFYGVQPGDGRTFVTNDGALHALTTLVEDFEVTTGAVGAVTDQGEPALIRNCHGHGVSIHVTTLPNDFLAEWLVQLACEEAGVRPVLPSLDPRIEAVSGIGGITLINQSAAELSAAVDGATFVLKPYETHMRSMPPEP